MVKEYRHVRNPKALFLLYLIPIIMGIFFYVVMLYRLGFVHDFSYQLSSRPVSLTLYADKELTLPVSHKKNRNSVTSYTRLPEDLPPTPTIFFYCKFQSVTVYLEDQILYNHSGSQNQINSTENGWQLLPLSQNSAGKTISIRLTPSLPFNAQTVYPLYLCSATESKDTINWLSNRAWVYGASLFFLGITLMLIALIIRIGQHGEKSILHLGFYIIFTALYILFSAGISNIFFFLQTLPGFEFFFLMLAPISDMCFFKSRPNGSNSLLVDTMLFIYSGFLVVVLVLCMLNVTSLLALSGIIFILYDTSCLISIILFYRGLKNGIKFNLLRTLAICVRTLGIIIVTVLFAKARIDIFPVILSVCLLLYVVVILSEIIGYYIEQNHLHQKDMEELQLTRIQLLTNQIKPHFIYNTLTAIQCLIPEDPEKARLLVNDFSIHLRAHIDNLTSYGLITFERELHYTKAYLNIEQIRFSGRIQAEYDIEFSDFSIPPLTIQPLVENAVKHGLAKRIRGGHIWISTRKENDACIIIIRDDGVGFDVASFENNKILSTGLDNIRFRLANMVNSTVSIISVIDEGTTVTITIPLS